MVAVSITQVENVSVCAELFPFFTRHTVLKGLNYCASVSALKAALDTNLAEACQCEYTHTAVFSSYFEVLLFHIPHFPRRCLA